MPNVLLIGKEADRSRLLGFLGQPDHEPFKFYNVSPHCRLTATDTLDNESLLKLLQGSDERGVQPFAPIVPENKIAMVWLLWDVRRLATPRWCCGSKPKRPAIEQLERLYSLLHPEADPFVLLCHWETLDVQGQDSIGLELRKQGIPGSRTFHLEHALNIYSEETSFILTNLVESILPAHG